AGAWANSGVARPAASPMQSATAAAARRTAVNVAVIMVLRSPWKLDRRVKRSLLPVLVVFDPQVGDLLLAHQPPQGVFQLGLLDEEIVLGVQTRGGLRALEVERQPLLDPRQPRAVRQVEEQRQVQHDRRGQNRIAT